MSNLVPDITTIPAGDDPAAHATAAQMTDRELAEATYVLTLATAQNIEAIRAIVESVKGDVQPTLEKIMRHPMLKMFAG